MSHNISNVLIDSTSVKMSARAYSVIQFLCLLIFFVFLTMREVRSYAYEEDVMAPVILVQQAEFGYFSQLTQLVEHMAGDTKRKVALVAHSMGGLMMAYFLMNRTQEWKDKHIHALITISTPWLGSPQSFQTYLTGSNFKIPTLKKSIMKPLVRTFPTVALLLPYEGEYEKTVLVDWNAKNKTYTGKEYQQFFTDIGYEDGYLMREDVRSLFPINLDQLGVRLFCIWSNVTKIKTVEKFNIDGELDDEKKIYPTYGEGDETVPIKSLRYCERFQGVTVKSFQGPSHKTIIFKGSTFDYIYQVLAHAQPFS